MLHSEEVENRSSKEIHSEIQSTLQSMNRTMGQLQSEIKRKGESIRHSFERARHALSVSDRARKNPWVTVGAAAAVGFIASEVVIPRLFGGKKTIEMRAKRSSLVPDIGPRGSTYEAVPEDAASAQSAATPQLNTFKSLAVGLALGTLRDFVLSAIPRSGETFTRNIFDQATKSLGGDPIRGRIL